MPLEIPGVHLLSVGSIPSSAELLRVVIANAKMVQPTLISENGPLLQGGIEVPPGSLPRSPAPNLRKGGEAIRVSVDTVLAHAVVVAIDMHDSIVTAIVIKKHLAVPEE
jgi:hypothetical protein